MKEKLTIILAVYNSCLNENLFRNTLNSICEQTSKEYKILLVYDKSSDNTREIIQEFMDKYGNKIELIENNEKIGMIQAYNIGISNVKTEYLTIITDNNELFPTFVEEMLSFVESSNLDFARSFWLKGQNIKNPYIHDNTGVCHIVRKKIFDEEGLLSLDVGWGWDSDLWYKVKHHMPPYRISLLHKILGKYYVVPNDQTTLLTRDEKMKESFRWHYRWKMRESRYIEESDIGHSLVSKVKMWVSETKKYYSKGRPLEIEIHDFNNLLLEDKYDIIFSEKILKDVDTNWVLKFLNNIATRLNKNGIFMFTLEIKKPSSIDLSECFKELNKIGIYYFPENNFNYTTRERSPPFQEDGIKYFRIFGLLK